MIVMAPTIPISYVHNFTVMAEGFLEDYGTSHDTGDCIGRNRYLGWRRLSTCDLMVLMVRRGNVHPQPCTSSGGYDWFYQQ